MGPSTFRPAVCCFRTLSDPARPAILMKILTLRQPWAYLITRGREIIENRSWPTKYRGPFLVHAAQAINREACEQHGLDPKELETGGVVAMAEIVVAYPTVPAIG